MGEKFDKFIADARETFMAMPEEPVITINDEGREITSCSTTLEATHNILSSLSLDEKLDLIRELCEGDLLVDFDPEFLDPVGKTFGEILDNVLVVGLVEAVEDNPNVKLRQSSNLDQMH